MPTKHSRRQLPAGYSPSDFTYKGRPAKDQGDFGDDVGIADMACVNQFGEANNSKHYHGGVVQAGDGSWWIYLEWGRVRPGRAWNGGWTGNSQDFQFVQCSREAEARKFFAKQLAGKNIKRLVQRDIGGVTVWTAKTDKKGKPKSGYLVQSLATREKGLPDAYTIKDDSGVQAPAVKPKTSQKTKKAPSRSFHPEVVALAQALVGGTQNYTRALSESSGVTPTMGAIERVRDELIPAAMGRIKVVGSDVATQIKDTDLQDLSKEVFSLVPQFIPRGGISEEEAILSGGNILSLQNDLDAFEAALTNEDFEQEAPAQAVNPDSLLGAQLRYIEHRSDEGRWLTKTFLAMSNHRHGYIQQDPRIVHMFAVTRPERDKAFAAKVAKVAKARKGQTLLRANLQQRRVDLKSTGDAYGQANVVLAQHGTRSVNVAPILQTHFRLPRSLPGAQITGANFGHGIYHSVDFRKAAGYVSMPQSYWSGGSGGIAGRNAFMFLCDMIMGHAYRAPSTGSWGSPPKCCVSCNKPKQSGYGTGYCSCGGKQVQADSVFGVGGDRGHMLQNDEHVVFDPDYTRIRYVVEVCF